MKRKANNFDVPPSEGQLQEQTLNSGVLVVSEENEAKATIKSGIQEDEKARLRQALLKNMEYIQKKDKTVRAAKFAPGGVYDQFANRPSYGNLMGGQNHRGGLGTGGAPVGKAPVQQAPNTSVYVNHLPKTVTWNQLDFLFSEHGKIKKIKLYRDDVGNPKGDALITYLEPGSVDTAVIKLNGHQIAPGVLISVNPANFSHKETVNPYLPEGTNMGHLLGQKSAPPPVNSDEPPLAYLPKELEGDRYPVVVCHNLYLKEHLQDPEFLAGLEAEMLIECSRYGEIVKLLTVPDIPYYFGAVCVSYKTWEDACNCANVMDGRFFDFRQMEVEMMGLRADRPGEPPLGVDPMQFEGDKEGKTQSVEADLEQDQMNATYEKAGGVDVYDTGHLGLGFSGDANGESHASKDEHETVAFLKSLEGS